MAAARTASAAVPGDRVQVGEDDTDTEFGSGSQINTADVLGTGDPAIDAETNTVSLVYDDGDTSVNLATEELN